MLNEKMRTLILKVLDSTRDGQIEWQETPDPVAFVAPFAGYILRIAQEFDREIGEDYYQFSLQSNNGRTMESVTDGVFDRDERVRAMDKEGSLSDLFVAARREAMGVDKAISDILKQLDDIPPF